MNDTTHPLLALTMGDPSGSGAELLNLALNKPEIRQICRPVVVGDAGLMGKARTIVGTAAPIQRLASLADVEFSEPGIPVLDLGNVDPETHRYGVIAMYHDQGHVAAKMLGIWKGVNVTLGLPIIRTSVEHGTDFPNAGTGKSDPRSLEQAIRLALQMAE